MNYRMNIVALSAAVVFGLSLSAAFAVPKAGVGFRSAAAPHAVAGFHGAAIPHPGPVPHAPAAAIPHGPVPGFTHGGPGFHPGAGIALAHRAPVAVYNPAFFHAPGAHWNGYHQVFVGNRAVHLGWAGYRPSFYYHPWYHGPWGGHVWGWGWSFAPGASFAIGGPGWGVGVSSVWGYGRPYWPYGPYGYWGRPLGWGYGGWGLGTIAYTSGYYPYYNPYYIAYGGGPIVYDYANPIPVAPSATAATSDPAPDGAAAPASNPQFDAAREEFSRGQYSAALNSINAAIRANPADAVMHEFRGLVLFARGDYRQAAAVVHSVLAVGPGWDWTTMSSLYPDPARYTQQLQALEDYAGAHPRDADVHFLLGYHYMIGGHAEQATAELQTVVRLMPSDRLADELLLMVKGPPQQQADDASEATDDPKPAPADDPQLPPLDRNALTGNWHASRGDGSKFRLTLSDDGTFHWKFSTPDQKGDEFSGTYTVDGPMLVLERQAGGVMAATATFDGTRRFNFRMVGGPPEDKGLDFSR